MKTRHWWGPIAFVVAFWAVLSGAEPPRDPAGGALSTREARIYQQVCSQCHARPGIGVPVVGDAEAWRERRARGLDALLATTVNGTRGMPPLGSCSFCSEAELRRLVAFVAGLPVPAEAGR